MLSLVFFILFIVIFFVVVLSLVPRLSIFGCLLSYFSGLCNKYFSLNVLDLVRIQVFPIVFFCLFVYLFVGFLPYCPLSVSFVWVLMVSGSLWLGSVMCMSSVRSWSLGISVPGSSFAWVAFFFLVESISEAIKLVSLVVRLLVNVLFGHYLLFYLSWHILSGHWYLFLFFVVFFALEIVVLLLQSYIYGYLVSSWVNY